MKCQFEQLRCPQSIAHAAVAVKQSTSEVRVFATVQGKHTSRHYKILEKVGEGGFGSVFKATQVVETREVGNKFAIKFSNSIIGNNPSVIEEVVNLLFADDRPHSVPLKDYGIHSGDFFIVMPLLEETLHDYLEMTPKERKSKTSQNAAGFRKGRLLRQTVKEERSAKEAYESSLSELSDHQGVSTQRRKAIEVQVVDSRKQFDRATSNLERIRIKCVLEETEAVLIGKQICEALVWLDRIGMIHGDLKPSNIVNLNGRADRFTPGIIDFGIAQRSSCTTTAGTEDYMSPERSKNPPEPDPKADVYSLGVILCKARGIKVESFEAKVSGVKTTKAFRTLIDRCICKSSSRLTSVEVLDSLERMLVPRRSIIPRIAFAAMFCLLIGVIYLSFSINASKDMAHEYEKLIKDAVSAQAYGKWDEMRQILREAGDERFKPYQDWELGYLQKRAINRYEYVIRNGIRKIAVSPISNLIASVSINDEAKLLQVEMFEGSELLNTPMGKLKSVWTETIADEGVVDLAWNQTGDRLAFLTTNRLFVFEIAGSQHKRIIETQTAPRPISKVRFMEERIVAFTPGSNSVEIFDLGPKAWSQSEAISEKLLEFVPCFGTDNTLDMAILGERGEFKLSGSRLEQIAPAVLFGPVESARENPDKKGTLVHRKGLSEFYEYGSMRSGTIPFSAAPVSLHIGTYSTTLVNITDYGRWLGLENIESSENGRIGATFSTVPIKHFPEGFSVGPTVSNSIQIYTKNRFYSTVLSPDGLSVATVSSDDVSVFALDANTRHDGAISLASFKQFDSPFNSVVWSHDGNLLAAAGRKFELVDSAQNSGIWTPIELHPSEHEPIVSVCFGRRNDTPILVLVASDGSINFWEIQRDNIAAEARAILKQRLPERKELPTKVLFHDQKFIICYEHSNDIKTSETLIVDCNSFSQTKASGKYDFVNGRTIAFSPDGKKVAYYKYGHELTVRNLEDQSTKLLRFPCSELLKGFTVDSLAFSPSGARVFALGSFQSSRQKSEIKFERSFDGYEHILVVFNANTGEELFQIPCPTGMWHSIQMGGNGVLALGWENGVNFFD
jgi:serine/threonine protein kinase/WD40 repeat protein